MAATTSRWAETRLMRGRVMRVVAHDPFPRDAEGRALPLPADFVMGVGGASQTLLDLTPRGHVGRALDVACGSAVQTLFLDADRIIATDVDARALEAANESCHLSGFRRLEPDVWRNGECLIEFRQGSLLEPVQSQRFDLIVANPPFVIEGVGHTHRDSPFTGDGLTEQLLAELPAHLNRSGRAVLLASWLHLQDDDWMRRVLSWIPVREVSAWVAQREVLDIDSYVEVWSADAAVPEAQRLLWRARLDELGATAVGFGWIVLERSEPRWVVVEDVSAASRVPVGDEVGAQLRAFSSPPDVLSLLHDHWNFVDDHWRGTLALNPFEAMLVERMRAGATLSEAIDTVAAEQRLDVDDLTALGLTRLRELVEHGYFVRRI